MQVEGKQQKNTIHQKTTEPKLAVTSDCYVLKIYI